MTRLEVIQMIGDLITEIDVARGSLMPDDSNRHTLDDQRILLDDRQRKLSQSLFNDNSQAFQDAAAKLATINEEISGTIKSVKGCWSFHWSRVDIIQCLWLTKPRVATSLGANPGSAIPRSAGDLQQGGLPSAEVADG